MSKRGQQKLLSLRFSCQFIKCKVCLFSTSVVVYASVLKISSPLLLIHLEFVFVVGGTGFALQKYIRQRLPLWRRHRRKTNGQIAQLNSPLCVALVFVCGMWVLHLLLHHNPRPRPRPLSKSPTQNSKLNVQHSLLISGNISINNN